MGCVSSKRFGDEERYSGQRKGSSTSLRRFLSLTRQREEDEEVVEGHAVVVPDASADLARSTGILKTHENVLQEHKLPALDGSVEKKTQAMPAGRCVHAGGMYRRKPSVDARRVSGVEQSAKDVTRNGEPFVKISDLPNAHEAEHVAAGWPRWLTDVAREAVKGWLPRKAESFERLDKIGQGTYSSVYKARDLETGKLVALKKVRFSNLDPESVRFMAREIHILRRLDHPNIVKLVGLVAAHLSSSLYLVFEYMEHDLAGIAAIPGIKFTEPQIKCYMQQLLSGLNHCHSHGVLHRDIKGANLLIDNKGVLKIADFGLATFFNANQKQQLTSRVITLWYRPPELLLGATNYDAAVDLWSAGCILAELLTGKPIMPGRTEVEQLHKIFKLCGSPSEEFWANLKLSRATVFKPQQPYRRCLNETFKDLPPSTLALLDSLLAVNPAARGTASSALQSEFFRTKPFACDLSSLPKYPPSKEYDAKLREEAKRQRAAAIKGQESESGKRKPLPLPDADANADAHKRLVQVNPKSNSYKYLTREDSGTEFRIDRLRRAAENARAQSTQQLGAGQSNGMDARTQKHVSRSVAAESLNFSVLAGQRSDSAKFGTISEEYKHLDPQERLSCSRLNPLGIPDAPNKQELSQKLLDRPSTSYRKDEEKRTKEPPAADGAKKNRVHFSGPLIPQGENMDEMLKEHERHVQQAVRRARTDTTKNIHGSEEKGLSESLLHGSPNG